jgi:hypothetical protein
VHVFRVADSRLEDLRRRRRCRRRYAHDTRNTSRIEPDIRVVKGFEARHVRERELLRANTAVGADDRHLALRSD